MRVTECPIPGGTHLAEFRDAAGYRHAEAVAATVPSVARLDPRGLARVALSRPGGPAPRFPALMDAWIMVQGVLLKPLGVSRNTMRHRRAQPLPVAGGRLGPYRVFSADQREVFLGDRDRLLDHRMSFISDGDQIVLGVVLRTLNSAGEQYWQNVKAYQTQLLINTLSQATAQVLGMRNP